MSRRMDNHFRPELPGSLILESPALATADAAAIGATFLILGAWWRSGCRVMPEVDADLGAVAGCYTRRWIKVRGTVKAALADIVPKLAQVQLERARRLNERNVPGAVTPSASHVTYHT